MRWLKKKCMMHEVGAHKKDFEKLEVIFNLVEAGHVFKFYLKI